MIRTGTPIYVTDLRGDRYEGVVVDRPALVTSRPAFPQLWVHLTSGPLAPAPPMPWPMDDVHPLAEPADDTQETAHG